MLILTHEEKSDMMRIEMEKKIEHLRKQICVLEHALTDRYEFNLRLSHFKRGMYWEGNKLR